MASHIIYEAQIAAVKEIQPVKPVKLCGAVEWERCENLVWPTLKNSGWNTLFHKGDDVGLEPLPMKVEEPTQVPDELATSVLVNSRSFTQQTTHWW